MRMSDWSSDVCSSDLLVGLGDPRRGVEQRCLFVTRELVDTRERLVAESALGNIDDAFERQIIGGRMDETEVGERVAYFRAFVEAVAADEAVRSEEHTSELQSLMRISSAVFSLKKKNKTENSNNQQEK